MRKIVFLWIALIAASMNAFADGKVSFTASAPDAVAETSSDCRIR